MTENGREYIRLAGDCLYRLERKGAESWSFVAVKGERGSTLGATVGVIRFGAPQLQGSARPFPPEVWDIYSLHVLRAYRGQGIASELHRCALEYAGAHGKLLRVLRSPSAAHRGVMQRLRAHRVAYEGGELLQGISATDPEHSR